MFCELESKGNLCVQATYTHLCSNDKLNIDKQLNG